MGQEKVRNAQHKLIFFLSENYNQSIFASIKLLCLTVKRWTMKRLQIVIS